MKKYGSLIIALALVTLVGTMAWARGGWGGGYGMGPGYGYSQATPEQREAFAKFQMDTLEQRKQLAVKRVELRTLYSQPSPDQARINALKNQITDLRAQIDKKAIEAGLTTGSGRGYGKGPGYGRGGGYCWR